MNNAFVLHIKTATGDHVPEALETGEIIIGCSKAQSLFASNAFGVDLDLSREDFRDILHKEFHANENNLRRAGKAAGNLWRFLREMEVGDYVVVPNSGDFYVAEVVGDARNVAEK